MTDKPYTDTDVELVAQAMRDANRAVAWQAAQGVPMGHFARMALDALATAGRLAPAASTEPEQPERDEVRWAYRWIGRDGKAYDEMDASNNAIETAEQRAHRIAAKRLTGTVRGEVLRYRVLTMPAEVVATYPADRAQDAEPCRGCFACSTEPTEQEG